MSRPPREDADAPDARAARPPGRPTRNPTALAARVLVVQALTLLALWILQATFGGG